MRNKLTKILNGRDGRGRFITDADSRLKNNFVILCNISLTSMLGETSDISYKF